MRFHLNGYTAGDPSVAPAHPSSSGRPAGLPGTVDVLIVGCGPAGLLLAAQLSAFPGIHTVVVDRRDGPLEVGQADGVACRSVEILEAFGLADRLIAEGYQVNEVTFWHPDPGDPASIVRTGRIDDVEDGISEMPHMIVNQARMLEYLRDHMHRSPARAEPVYGVHVTGVRVDADPATEYPVTVDVAHLLAGEPTGRASTVRARHVVGCDGARSSVRRAIGRTLEGDSENTAWGVLDVLAVTDFPDVRVKSAITSAHGSALVIPREGGYLVRIYIELDADRDAGVLRDWRGAGSDPARARDATIPERLVAVAGRILHPYAIDVRHVAWWAIYEIGQRLCSRFDDLPDDTPDSAHTDSDTDTGTGTGGRLPRVFIAGDACHTHSAKAGQGMNVSMADAWNLGWKLGTVLNGTGRPELLHTYSPERQAVAQELIDFDREFSALFSTRSDAGDDGDDGDEGDTDPGRLQTYFRRQGRFTAGVAVRYRPSRITAEPVRQHLATGFPIGMRFRSAPVVRVADARRMHLGHAARADGAWRLYAFADRHDLDPASALSTLAARLPSLTGRFTPAGAEPDSVVDVRAVLQRGHREIDVGATPAALQPRKGRFALVDYEKVFSADPAGDVFDLRGVDRDRGCVVVVRPDQYVAAVVPLDGDRELAEFLDGVLVARPRG